MSAPHSGIGPASAGPIFNQVAALVRVATGAVLIALVVLVCTEAALRGFANISLGFAEEVTGYFVVMLTFFGAALALRSGALFRVHFLFDVMPRGTRTLLQRVFIVTAFLACLLLAWKTNDLMLSSLARDKFAPTVLRTPLWIPQLLMPAGFAVLGFFLVEQFLLTLRGGKGVH